VRLLCDHFMIAARSLRDLSRNRRTIVAQSPRNFRSIASQSPRNRRAIAEQSSLNRR
jgi:hypothetical protein